MCRPTAECQENVKRQIAERKVILGVIVIPLGHSAASIEFLSTIVATNIVYEDIEKKFIRSSARNTSAPSDRATL
jgi:hypothetical protein